MFAVKDCVISIATIYLFIFHSLGLFLCCFFGKQSGTHIQQVNLPFKASGIDPFLAKFLESVLGNSKWLAFTGGSTECPYFWGPSREWTCCLL